MKKEKKKTPSLLAADDDSVIRELLKYYVTRSGISHEIYENGDTLMKHINEDVQVCVLDIDMPGSSGLECLEKIKKQFPQTEVIILTSNDKANDAITAIRSGAFDYITKPFDPDELINCVRNARLLNIKQKESLVLRSSFSEETSGSKLLGNSTAIEDVYRFIERIKDSQSPVLITGESGTGKTLLARQIHNMSSHQNGPFISVSCPAIPSDLMESEMFGHEKGAFSGAVNRKLGKAELANDGTLFLDEIGDMSLSLQVKLLNFIQDKSFYRVGGEKLIKSQTRIVAATNRNLADLVSQGLFREDLYFRLNVLPIEIPPLRDRAGDISILFHNFLQKLSTQASVEMPAHDEGLISQLSKHKWEGNVRELEHAVTRAFTLRENKAKLQLADFQFLFSKEINETDTPSTETKESEFNGFVGKSLSEIENIIIHKTIEHCSGNKSQAAKLLGIAEKSIYNKINRYKKNP